MYFRDNTVATYYPSIVRIECVTYIEVIISINARAFQNNNVKLIINFKNFALTNSETDVIFTEKEVYRSRFSYHDWRGYQSCIATVSHACSQTVICVICDAI